MVRPPTVSHLHATCSREGRSRPTEKANGEGRLDDRPPIRDGHRMHRRHEALAVGPLHLDDVARAEILDRHDMAQPLSLARSEEHTSELQSLMRISSAAFCLKTKIRIANEYRCITHTHNIDIIIYITKSR